VDSGHDVTLGRLVKTTMQTKSFVVVHETPLFFLLHRHHLQPSTPSPPLIVTEMDPKEAVVTYAVPVEATAPGEVYNAVYDLEGNIVVQQGTPSDRFGEEEDEKEEDEKEEDEKEEDEKEEGEKGGKKKTTKKEKSKRRKRGASSGSSSGGGAAFKRRSSVSSAGEEEEEEEEDEWLPASSSSSSSSSHKALASPRLVLAGQVVNAAATSKGVRFDVHGPDLNSGKSARTSVVLPFDDMKALGLVELGPDDMLYEQELARWLPPTEVEAAARLLRNIYYDGPHVTIPGDSPGVQGAWTGQKLIHVPSRISRSVKRDELAEVATMLGLPDVGLLIAVVGMLVVYQQTKVGALWKMCNVLVEQVDAVKLASTSEVQDVTDLFPVACQAGQRTSKSSRAKALCIGAACFNEAWKNLYDQVLDLLGASPVQKVSFVAMWNTLHKDAVFTPKDKHVVASMLVAIA